MSAPAKKRRGRPQLGAQKRSGTSVKLDPMNKAHALAKWGAVSTAVNELLRKDRERDERRRANRLVDIQTGE